MDLLEGIYTRRSRRSYTDRPVDREALLEIIKAGTWAPSGLNNQPWRFVTVTGREIKSEIAAQTKYSRIVDEAPACIAVFVDREDMYHELKDHQAMGACIQNMLLAAHALDLGAVWLGEILKKGEAVRRILDLPDNLRLMALICVGHPSGPAKTSHRRDHTRLLLKEL
jgi:nitroreductase